MRAATKFGTTRSILSALIAIAVLGACKPDVGSRPTTTAATTTAPATTPSTVAPGGELTGVSLGFNNAEQGVIAPDGTPLLVVVRQGSVEVVRGSTTDGIRAGGAGKVATPAIAASGTRVAVAWAETVEGGGSTVKAAVSGDSGLSFAPEQVLGPGSGPSLAASGETIVAVWHDGVEGGSGGDIVMARMPAATDTWDASKAIDDSPAAPLWASVDARGSNVVVGWRDDRDGAYSVWTRTSPDLGATWAPEVHAVTASSGDPDVCIDPEGTIWLGHHGRGGIYLTRSTDGGASYVPGERVGDGWFAHVSCDTGVVALAWEETTAPPKAPEADKAAGWATFSHDLQSIARGSEGGPDAAGAAVVPTAGEGLDLVWSDGAQGALTGTLHRFPIPD